MARQKGKDNSRKVRKGRTMTGSRATPVVVFSLTTAQPNLSPSQRLTVENGKFVFNSRKKYSSLMLEYLNFSTPAAIDAQSRTIVPFKRPGEEQAVDGFVLGNDQMIALKSNIPLPGRAEFGDANQRQRRRQAKMWQFSQDDGGNSDEYS